MVYKTTLEACKALNKAGRELFDEIARALRLEKIYNFLKRILKQDKKD
ncbi:MAG: hypothetical protein HQ555_07815 [Candidatus Aminicenantes bacterium]|nr:hypothetical protein [Candidatus Aminicenantes bacterium]